MCFWVAACPFGLSCSKGYVNCQVEMTGDFTPDLKALLTADIIISTPEKWDGISRNWQSRSYVMKVAVDCLIYFIINR